MDLADDRDFVDMILDALNPPETLPLGDVLLTLEVLLRPSTELELFDDFGVT